MIQLFPRFACTYSIQYLCILVSIYSSHPSTTTALLPCLLSIHQFVRRFIFFLNSFIYPSNNVLCCPTIYPFHVSFMA